MRTVHLRALLGVLAWLAGGGAWGASLSLDKGPVVLGRTESVGVTLRVEEPPGAEERPLRVAVNVGTFAPVTRQAPGVYRTVYVPPPTRFPQEALVAVWRETGPEAPIEFLHIPLYGITRLQLRSKPGAEARVQVGLEEFGPVKVNRQGRAELPVSVPPGVREVRVHAQHPQGALAEKTLRVDVPPYNRLTAALVPHALVADGRAWARVEVFYDLGGVQVPASRVKLEPSLGTATLLKAENGRYVFRYQPPAGTDASEVRFRVSVEGDSKASATARLELGLPAPATALLRVPDKPLPADGRSRAELSLLVFDDAGLGLTGQKVEVRANGQPLVGVVDAGDGFYRVPFTAPAVHPPGGLVRFEASVTGRQGAPVRTAMNYQLLPAPVPRGLLAHVAPAPVPADGATRARLTLDVRDAAGLPLEGARLILVASHGSVSPLTPREGGRYEATYLAPEELSDGPAEVRVVDASGQFEQHVPIPLRAAPRRLLVGARAGFAHSLGEQSGPRVGLDVWVPLRLGDTWFGAGLTATVSRARQSVTDASGTLRSDSEALYAPVGLRLGGELYAGRRLSLVLGAGATATLARFSTSLTGERVDQLGWGGVGFLNAGWALGPGQLFGELSYAFAPVRSERFQLDAGGPGLDVGYRFGVF